MLLLTMSLPPLRLFSGDCNQPFLDSWIVRELNQDFNNQRRDLFLREDAVEQYQIISRNQLEMLRQLREDIMFIHRQLLIWGALDLVPQSVLDRLVVIQEDPILEFPQLTLSLTLEEHHILNQLEKNPIPKCALRSWKDNKILESFLPPLVETPALLLIPKNMLMFHLEVIARWDMELFDQRFFRMRLIPLFQYPPLIQE